MPDGFFETLSEASGFEKQVVWQAVKRGKFGVENIHDEETKRLLETTLSPEVYFRTFSKNSGS